jgi:hypothetical protein
LPVPSTTFAPRMSTSIDVSAMVNSSQLCPRGDSIRGRGATSAAPEEVPALSAQHRAQILSILGDCGQKVPDMDYVVMRLEGQTTPDAGHAEKA